MEYLITSLVLLVVFGTILFWSLLMQRKSMARQKQAMDTQHDAIERQKKAMAQVEESLRLDRQQIENQEKIIVLLEQIRDSKSS